MPMSISNTNICMHVCLNYMYLIAFQVKEVKSDCATM